MVEPISPNNVVELKESLFPDWIIKTWNILIAINLKGNSSIVTQDEAVNALMVAGNITSRSTIFNNNYLEIEDIYRKKGWKVEYDKPAYNESYEAYFKFSKK